MRSTLRKPEKRYAARAHKRHAAQAVSSDLGTVLDLSVGGARIACRRRPPLRVGSIVPINLQHTGGIVELHAQVIWLERRGMLRWEMGLRLASSSAPIRRALRALLGERQEAAEAEADSARQAPPRGPAVSAALALPSYYMTLGVKPGSSLQQVRAAYHREARKYHPDVNRSPNAAAQFIKIKEAYEVLRSAAHATAEAPL